MKKKLFYFNAILVLLVFFITCSLSESEISQLNIQLNSFTFTKYINSDILEISNSGEAELSWEITDKPDWLEVSKSSGKVTTGTDTVNITVNVNQATGEYSGTINIESNGGNEEINVLLNIAVWAKMKNMPTARGTHAVGTVNGKIYAIGGFKKGSLSSVEEYDPATNTWTIKSPMQRKRGDLAGCVANGKIYAIGGFAQSNTFSYVEEYNPITDTWTRKANMPTERWGHFPVTVNGKIYVIGGAFGWNYTTNEPHKYYETIEVYNPMTDTWTTEGTIPTPRWFLSCSVVNGKIYAIGGQGKTSLGISGTSSIVEEYDPVTGTWTTKTPMPTARWGLTAATINGKIYVIGGGDAYKATKCYKTVEEYDAVTDIWTTKTSMPVGLIVSATGVVNGKIYVVGGMGITTADTHAEVYEYELGLE